MTHYTRVSNYSYYRCADDTNVYFISHSKSSPLVIVIRFNYYEHIVLDVPVTKLTYLEAAWEEIVYAGLVRSGFLPQKWATGNRNRLPDTPKSKNRDRNRFFQFKLHFVVTCKKLIFFEVFFMKPVVNCSI